jgi:hypothetical protein
VRASGLSKLETEEAKCDDCQGSDSGRVAKLDIDHNMHDRLVCAVVDDMDVHDMKV